MVHNRLFDCLRGWGTMVSFKAACFRLGIDKQTLYRLIREGKLECRKNGQRGRNCITLGSVEEMERISDRRPPGAGKPHQLSPQGLQESMTRRSRDPWFFPG
jgi:hypothetical protein